LGDEDLGSESVAFSGRMVVKWSEPVPAHIGQSSNNLCTDLLSRSTHAHPTLTESLKHRLHIIPTSLVRNGHPAGRQEHNGQRVIYPLKNPKHISPTSITKISSFDTLHLETISKETPPPSYILLTLRPCFSCSKCLEDDIKELNQLIQSFPFI
jgi:hypothetical protein